MKIKINHNSMKTLLIAGFISIFSCTYPCFAPAEENLRVPINSYDRITKIFERFSEADRLKMEAELSMLSQDWAGFNEIVKRLKAMDNIEVFVAAGPEMKEKDIAVDIILSSLVKQDRLTEYLSKINFEHTNDERAFLEHTLDNIYQHVKEGVGLIIKQKIVLDTGDMYSEISVIDNGPGFIDRSGNRVSIETALELEKSPGKGGREGLGLPAATKFYTDFSTIHIPGSSQLSNGSWKSSNKKSFGTTITGYFLINTVRWEAVKKDIIKRAVLYVEDMELASAIENTSPPDTDIRKVYDFIAARFGQQRDEALSMMGRHLLDPARWELIDEALDRKLSITSIADLLYYKALDGEVRMETFPAWFRELVLTQSGFSSTGMHRHVVDILWSVYYRQKHLDLASGSPLLDKLVKITEQDRMSGEILGAIQGKMPDYSARDITKFIVSKLRDINVVDSAYNFGGINRLLRDDIVVEEESAGGAPLRLNNLRLKHELKKSQLAFTSADLGSRKEGFYVWLTDMPLCRELSQYIRTKYGSKGPVLLSSVEFELISGDGTAQVDMLQGWLRIDSRFPKGIREKIGPVSSAEEISAEAFYAYAVQRGFNRIRAPAGSQLFASDTELPMHRNTIERLNNLYRRLGYKLIYEKDKWWWELEMPYNKYAGLDSRRTDL